MPYPTSELNNGKNTNRFVSLMLRYLFIDPFVVDLRQTNAVGGMGCLRCNARDGVKKKRQEKMSFSIIIYC